MTDCCHALSTEIATDLTPGVHVGLENPERGFPEMVVVTPDERIIVISEDWGYVSVKDPVFNRYYVINTNNESLTLSGRDYIIEILFSLISSVQFDIENENLINQNMLKLMEFESFC